MLCVVVFVYFSFIKKLCRNFWFIISKEDAVSFRSFVTRFVKRMLGVFNLCTSNHFL